jgi:hypothetical protein
MNTIYSKIIWMELGLGNYKIHEEPLEKTEGLVLDWIKKTPVEKVEKVLFSDDGLSYLSNITFEDYYDGPFFGLNQRDKDKRIKRDDGSPEPDIIVHDTGVLPTILHIAIKTKMVPSDFTFIAKILEAYWEKIPKPEPGTCSMDSLLNKKSGEEI